MDELKQIAQKLSSLEKKNSFLVSESYFEELPHQIIDRIHSSKEKKRIVNRALLKFGIPSIALSIVIFWNTFQSTSSSSSISSSEIEEYIQNNSNYVSEDIVEELASLQPERYNTSKEIEDYLLDTDIDENLLRDEVTRRL